MMAREVPQQNKVGGIWGVPPESSGHVASSGRSLGLSQSAVPSCESKEEANSSFWGPFHHHSPLTDHTIEGECKFYYTVSY